MADSIKLTCDQASILIELLKTERITVVERLSERKFKVNGPSSATLSKKFREGLAKMIRNDEERLENINYLITTLKDICK